MIVLPIVDDIYSTSSNFKKAAADKAACPSSPLSCRRRRTDEGATASRYPSTGVVLNMVEDSKRLDEDDNDGEVLRNTSDTENGSLEGGNNGARGADPNGTLFLIPACAVE